MTKKFEQIYESALTRASRGGFLVGDYIKFADGFKSKEPYKLLAQNVKDLIADIMSAGLNVQIVGIVDKNTPRFPGNPDTMTGDVVLNIALDNGGGRYTHYCTIPSCCVEPVDFYPNLAPFPDSVVRPNGTTLTPVEHKMECDNQEVEDQTLKCDQSGKLKHTEITLPTKNVKLPNTHTVKGAKTPSVGDYSIKYLKDF